MNRLYYGDNLDVLRSQIGDGSVDLVYLDPPFNSNAGYNVLFKQASGAGADASIEAFDDTWTWGPASQSAILDIAGGGASPSGSPNYALQRLIEAMRSALGDSPLMAYLAMMAVRLVELHRVLKDTGSLYLHCDPTASHYLKLVLDAVFGADHLLNEVIWKRTGTHSSARRWGPVHDVILFYARDRRWTWNRPYVPLDDEHRKRHYRMQDATGRRYTHGELTAPGTRNGRSGAIWKGFDVTAIGRHWMTTADNLDTMFADGRIYLPEDGSWPRLIRYEDEGAGGRAIGDVWTDIPPLNMMAKERLGYPTQKPRALLERIIAASSNPGDIVLDPFCGCGTAVDAAQKLGGNGSVSTSPTSRSE